MSTKQVKIFTQIILFLIIIFSVGSVYVLLLALGFVTFLPDFFQNASLLPGYAILSLVLTILVSAYHIKIMLSRNRRKYDGENDAKSAASVSRQILSKNN